MHSFVQLKILACEAAFRVVGTEVMGHGSQEEPSLSSRFRVPHVNVHVENLGCECKKCACVVKLPFSL